MSAARIWFSAAELAGTPGLPTTKSAVIRRADTEAWQYREVTARGGLRREYHLTSLPAQARAALMWKKTEVVAGDRPAAVRTAEQLGTVEGAKMQLQADLVEQGAAGKQAHALAASGSMPKAHQLEMDARLALLRLLDIYRKTNLMPMTTAEHHFATAYNAGQIAIDADVQACIPTVSPKSLQRWRLTLKSQGITALAPQYGNRKGQNKIDTHPTLQAFVQAMLTKFPNVLAQRVLEAIETRFANDIVAGEIDVPSVRSIERWMKHYRQQNAEVLLALANPDAWKNTHMVAFGSISDGIERVNQLWELDSTPADVMCSDGRKTLICVIDVATRRPKIHVSSSEKSIAVAALYRRALLDWGVPETIKMDNGSAFKSRHMERVHTALGIVPEYCEPFSPWQKGHIERFQGAFAHGLAELLQGFIGHSVAQRQAIEARKSFADRLMKRGEVVELTMTGAELQGFCDRWVDSIYMHNPHAGLGDRTPYQVLNSIRNEVRVIRDERQLDVLLAEAPGNDGWRTVQKKGIAHDNGWFIAPELEAYVGQRVLCRFDDISGDLGRLLVYAGNDMAFLCVAENPERTGMDRREVAIKGREMQKKRVQDMRAALKAEAKKVGVDDIVEEILVERGKKAGKLASLPRPTVEHTSAGLAAAASTLEHLDKGQGTSAELLQLEGVAERWRAMKAEAVNDAPTGEDNELARRRAPEAQPVFNTPHERAQWIVKQGRVRALTEEERDYVTRFKKESPASYRRIVELVDEMLATQKEAPDASGAM